MDTKEFNIFKKKAMKFKMQGNHFFCWNCKNIPMRQIVDNLVKRQTILQQLYNESGYNGRENTYRQVANRY